MRRDCRVEGSANADVKAANPATSDGWVLRMEGVDTHQEGAHRPAASGDLAGKLDHRYASDSFGSHEIKDVPHAIHRHRDHPAVPFRVNVAAPVGQFRRVIDDLAIDHGARAVIKHA